MTTGIIGIGSMGMAMARNLHRKGLDLLVHDVRADALQAAAASGIKIAATPAEIARQCDLIIIVVVNAKQIAQVLSDAQGVLAAEAATTHRAKYGHHGSNVAGRCSSLRGGRRRRLQNSTLKCMRLAVPAAPIPVP